MMTSLLPLPHLQLFNNIRNRSLPHPFASSALHFPGTLFARHEQQKEDGRLANRGNQARVGLRKIEANQGLQDVGDA